MEKSYNPLKMWGAWVGFLIGVFPILIFYLAINGLGSYANVDLGSYFSLHKLNPVYYIEKSIETNSPCDLCGIFTLLSLPIVFFLYGWAIHSIFRKLRSS